MSQQTGSPVLRDPQEIQAVRETIAEWLRHHADRVESGRYMLDLEGGTVLTEPQVRSLVVRLKQICGAAAVGMDSSAEEEELRKAMRAAEQLSADLADELLVQANMRRTEDMLEAPHAFGDQAREKGRKAVTSDETREILSPGFRWAPDQIPFHPHIGAALLRSVIDAIHRHVPVAEVTNENPAGRFIGHLKQAAQRLDRIHRESGPSVEEDAMRAALPKLEEAANLRGSTDRVDDFTATLSGGEIREPLATTFHAAGYVLDWALAGCRARLAELE